MKASKLILLLIITIFTTNSAQAQFWKKLKKRAKQAAERTIERKVEEKAEKETEKAFDSVFNNQNEKKIFRKRKREERRKKRKQRNRKSREENTTEENTTEDNANTVNYNSDFESGTQVVFSETFSQVALNDFPGTWNTNGGGSIVTFGNNDTKWLRMDPNVSFMPEITSIPNNSTLEFDLKVDDNYYKISKGIEIVLAQFNNRDIDFNQFYSYKGKRKRNAVIITLDPITHTSYGTHANTYVDGQNIINKSLGNNGFNKDNRTVHISIWRQETRLRFYIDGQKIWDLPRAFSKNTNYNALLLGVHRGKPDDAFYISNIRLAKAGEDTRVKLLESGSFSTSDIQFDSGKSTLKASSISIIEQLVQELNETPNTKVKIIGHTDSDGSSEANQNLSRERAYAVKEKMIKLGITNYERISVEGKGESEPVANNNTSEGKAQNRRVEFVIIN